MDRRALEKHLRPLSALEMSRLAPEMLKQVVFMAILGGVGVFIKGAGVIVFLYIILFSVACSIPAFVAANAGRDKADGTLDVLCSLPVSCWTLCLGRMRAVALVSIVSGLLGGIATVLSLPPTATSLSQSLVVIYGFLIACAAPLILSAVMAGLAVRSAAEKLIRAVMIGFLVVVVGSNVADKVIRRLLELLLGIASLHQNSINLAHSLLQQPGLLAVGLGFSMLVVVVAGGLSAMFLTASFEKFRTQRTPLCTGERVAETI